MRSFLTNVRGEESRDEVLRTSAWEARWFELARCSSCREWTVRFLKCSSTPPLRLNSPQARSGMTQSLICIKSVRSRNFDKIYLNSIKHSHNIKLNVLKLLFTSGFEFLHHVAFYNSFLTRREKWKWTVEMTYNKYLLKHQHISMAITFRNLSWMAYCLKSNFQKQFSWPFNL